MNLRRKVWIWARLGVVTVLRLACGRRRGGVEGVWVQRAAGKSDCGEGGGVGGRGGCREEGVDVKGSVAFWWSCMRDWRQGAFALAGARQISAVQ